MITAELGNSYSKIKGLSPEHEKKLRKLLSYSVNPNASFYGRFVMKKSLLSKRNEFPTGLWSKVKSFLVENDLHCEFLDSRRIPQKGTFIPLKGVKPYEDQKEAVKRATRTHRGTISMPTGTGKSLVIAMIHSHFGLNTLVVVPSLEIKRQLTENLKEALVSSSKIRVENIDSPELKKLKDFQCLIIDEAHHVAAKTYQKLNKTVWNNIYYRFFLTATPFRNQTEEQLLFESIAGELIYKLSYKEAISKGYIVPVEAYYLTIPKQISYATTWQEVYSELVVNNAARNKIISELLTSLNAAGKSTLCLVKEVEHGKRLKENSSLDFTHGSDDNRSGLIKHFNKGSLVLLIGTTGILGEGVDTKPCEYVVIAGLGKAKSHFMQQVGRAVRKYPGKESAKVILFQDESHKFTRRHFKEQCRILKEEYGITPIKL